MKNKIKQSRSELMVQLAGKRYPDNLRWVIVRTLVGLLLVVVAALKFYGLRVSSISTIGVFSHPGIQMAILQWELILGLWLIWGKWPLGAWITGVGTFTTFAVVSGYLGWIGQANCGCFGSIKASPWVALTIDVVVLIALLIGRPHRANLSIACSQGNLRRGVTQTALFVSGVSLVAAFVVGGASLWFGSFDAAVAALRGEQLSIRPGVVDLGNGSPQTVVVRTVELTNRTDHPIRVFGGTSDCSCVTTEDLPVSLEPGSSQAVTIRVQFPTAPGMFNRKAWFWTDLPHARTIVFSMKGRIDSKAPEE